MTIGKVKDFDFSQFRERDWQNVLTCHNESTQPFLWSYANHSISKIEVKQPEKLQEAKITSVIVSNCGNFGILGYENGLIQKFNMQSGLDKGLYSGQVHLKEVSGLGIDILNHYLVSCSLDHTIKLWDFYRKSLLRTIEMEYPIENMCYNRSNDLVAISSSDIANNLKRQKWS